MSDIGKILYLEVIDLTFSIDGVVGAFAFTLSVPLILLGNGIGAIVVRQLTVYGVDRIKKYVFLKNGAMYSVFVLGCVMLAHGFGYHVPEWLTPVATFFIVGYFFFKSRWQAKKVPDMKKPLRCEGLSFPGHAAPLHSCSAHQHISPMGQTAMQLKQVYWNPMKDA